MIKIAELSTDAAYQRHRQDHLEAHRWQGKPGYRNPHYDNIGIFVDVFHQGI